MRKTIHRFVETCLLTLTLLYGLVNICFFAFWWFKPDTIGHPVLYALLTYSIWLFIIRSMLYWFLVAGIQPLPEKPPIQGFTVDCFTTAASGEPVEMIQKSLRALKAMTYPHNTYLLDDSGNPKLSRFCRRNNIQYITRTEKKHAKCGNVNNGLRQTDGQFIMIIDPDHIVKPDFLSAALPYFDDPKVGFVQVAQAYHNQGDNFVANAGAEQTYLFYGPVMQGLARYNANLVIGTNTVFRRKALESIGLYQPGLAEDLHTSMALHGKGWKSRYVPKILARGLTPGDMGAFFHQQLKWSRGVMELLFHNFFNYAKGMTNSQRVCYLLNMSYYFESISVAINLLLPLVSLCLGIMPLRGEILFGLYYFLPIILTSCILFLWAQKWNCDQAEQGLLVRAMLMRYLDFTAHLVGIGCSIFGIKIPYIATAKKATRQFPFKLLIPQMAYVGLALLAIGLNLASIGPDDTQGMLILTAWNLVFISLAIVWAYTSTVSPDFKRHLRLSPAFSRLKSKLRLHKKRGV